MVGVVRNSLVAWAVAGALVGLVSCGGEPTDDRNASDHAASTGGGAGSDGEAGSGGAGSDGEAGSGGAGSGGTTTLAPRFAKTTRLPRLTHAEWENTVRDLFYLDAPPEESTAFPADPKTAGFIFDNDGGSLEVDQVLFGAYQRAARAIAERVTTDSMSFARFVPPTTDSDLERARAFIENFGKRAFRRPLTPAEVERYEEVYAKGDEAYTDTSGLQAGIRLVIEAMLQSPYFLYRVESSTDASSDRIALNGWERAARLSYFVTGSMPDDELFDAAERGDLAREAGMAEQAARLLARPEARAESLHFHDQLFEVERYSTIAPSTSAFPDVPPELAADALEETHRFVEDAVFDSGGSLADLLTSRTAFVNRDLAEIYGLDGTFDASFRRAALGPAERSGLLTRVGFLASNATSMHPDAIHRGVFIVRRLTCQNITAPPNGVPPLPPIEETTTRKAIEEHTQTDATCNNCHGPLINPFGFPFESYDAIGAYRTEDNGFPVDTTASPLIDGEPTPVEDALDLSEKLAASAAVHACYASHLVEFAFGRPAANEDAPLVAELAADSLDDRASVAELMQALSVSEEFMNRSAEELP